MDVAELPGSKARNFTISNRLCTSVPCSMQRLAAVAKVPGPHLIPPSIDEAPPTRCHAGRLVRVAYHAACSKMGAPGWTSPWSVMGCSSTLRLSPCPQAQQAQQPSQHAVAEIRSVQPGWHRQPSRLQASRYKEDYRCYLQPDFGLLALLYMAVCLFICPTRHPVIVLHAARAIVDRVCPSTLQWCA